MVVLGIVESISAECKLSKARPVLKYSLIANLLQKQIYQPWYQIQRTVYLEPSLFIELYQFIQIFYWMPGSIWRKGIWWKIQFLHSGEVFQRKYLHIWERGSKLQKRPHFVISDVNNNGSYLLCIYSLWAVSVQRFHSPFRYSPQHYEFSVTVIFVLQIRAWRIKEIKALAQIKQLTSGRARIHIYSVCIFNFLKHRMSTSVSDMW